MRTNSVAAMSVAAALLVGAVSSAGASPVAGNAACQNTKLTSGASGRTVSVKPCDTITISLKQSSDGGYLWSVANAAKASVLKLVSAKTITPGHPAGTVGGTTLRVFVYKAVSKGATSLKLAEARSFQKNSTVASFVLRVSVA